MLKKILNLTVHADNNGVVDSHKKKNGQVHITRWTEKIRSCDPPGSIGNDEER